MLKQKGNSVLELLLFLPIALFFLFVVIDAGLSLIQRAAINDAFRSGVNSLPAYVKAGQNNYQERQELYTQVVSKLAQEIGSNVSQVFSSYDSTEGNFEVAATLYRVDIDPIAGKLLSQFPESVANFKQGAIANVKLLQAFNRADDYIENAISKDRLDSISSFAEPLGYVNNPIDATLSGQRYAPVSWLVYSEVRAIPVGVNSSFLESALGGLYSVQRQQLVKIRDY